MLTLKFIYDYFLLPTPYSRLPPVRLFSTPYSLLPPVIDLKVTANSLVCVFIVKKLYLMRFFEIKKTNLWKEILQQHHILDSGNPSRIKLNQRRDKVTQHKGYPEY